MADFIRIIVCYSCNLNNQSYLQAICDVFRKPACMHNCTIL